MKVIRLLLVVQDTATVPDIANTNPPSHNTRQAGRHTASTAAAHSRCLTHRNTRQAASTAASLAYRVVWWWLESFIQLHQLPGQLLARLLHLNLHTEEVRNAPRSEMSRQSGFAAPEWALLHLNGLCCT
jgi:hypothetical protein